MSFFSSTSSPQMTLLFCALFSILYLILSFRVIYFRMKEKTPLGYKVDTQSRLFRSIRIHANFNEYVPFFLVILGMMEITGISRTYISALGWSMLVGRILHVIGLERTHGTSVPRFVGSFLNFGCFVAAIILILLRLVR